MKRNKLNYNLLTQKEKELLTKLVSRFTSEIALFSNDRAFEELRTKGIIVVYGETKLALLSNSYDFIKNNDINVELNYEAYGYSLEKEGKFEEAKAVYWEKINEKFIGDYPYNRLRIIYTKEKNWEQAISVCKRYINVSNDPVKKKRFGDWLRKYKAKVNKETEILTTKYFADKYLLTSRKESTSSEIVCPHFKYPAHYKDILKKIVFVYEGSIPEFFGYSPSLDDILPSQKAFFQKWLSNWKQGKAFHLQGNHGYLLVYIKKLLSKENLQSGLSAIIEQLHLIRDIYSQESFNRFNSLIFYITFWIYECYLIADLKTVATSWLRRNLLLINNTNSSSRLHVIESYLSLKYYLNFKIEGIDLYCLSRSNRKYRNILQENKDEVINFLDKKINEFEAQYNIDLLKLMSEKFGTLIRSTMSFLSEFNLYHQSKLNIPFYSYSELGELNIFFEQWLRDVENGIRDKLKLPKIGEGWVRETQLYNIILEYFGKQGYEVVHNAYPPFLDGLELDIFIPQLKLAIEHQGEQHVKAIDFFGGNGAYEALKERDKRKRRLCKECGISLVEVFYNEPLTKEYIMKRIQSFFNQLNLKKEL